MKEPRFKSVWDAIDDSLAAGRLRPRLGWGLWLRWKRFEFAADFIGRHAQIIGGLQVEPELAAGLEPVAQAQAGAGRCRRLWRLALNDLRDEARWHGNLS